MAEPSITESVTGEQDLRRADLLEHLGLRIDQLIDERQRAVTALQLLVLALDAIGPTWYAPTSQDWWEIREAIDAARAVLAQMDGGRS